MYTRIHFRKKCKKISMFVLFFCADKQLDGRCKNVTVGTCVSTCYDKCDGYYQSCKRCSGYVTCDGRVLHERNCPGALVWTDDRRRCESTSNTCNLTDWNKHFSMYHSLMWNLSRKHISRNSRIRVINFYLLWLCKRLTRDVYLICRPRYCRLRQIKLLAACDP